MAAARRRSRYLHRRADPGGDLRSGQDPPHPGVGDAERPEAGGRDAACTRQRHPQAACQWYETARARTSLKA